MKNQPGTGAAPTVSTEQDPTVSTEQDPTVSTEQDNEWARQRREELRKEATVFADQLAALEREYAAASTLLKMLGRAFGFGAAGKLERARFKVSYKRQQLAEFESLHPDERPQR